MPTIKEAGNGAAYDLHHTHPTVRTGSFLGGLMTLLTVKSDEYAQNHKGSKYIYQVPGSQSGNTGVTHVRTTCYRDTDVTQVDVLRPTGCIPSLFYRSTTVLDPLEYTPSGRSKTSCRASRLRVSSPQLVPERTSSLLN